MTVIVDEPAALSRIFSERCARAAAAAAQQGRPFVIALPGGSVATTFFPDLVAALDWTRAEVLFGDERAVPADHPDSNYGLAQRLLLAPAAVPADRVHRMPADAPDLEAAAAAHEAELRRVLGTPPRLDVALLGMGPDGHVCSLFPGHALLRERARWVAAVRDSPKPPPRRLTLTLPALALADLVVVAAFGEAKAPVVAAALADDASALPVALASRGARAGLWLLDRAAAGGGITGGRG